MKPKDDLFQIIRSMSKTEKRYFKLRARQYTGSAANNYLVLFDAIARSDSYDEQHIRQTLKGHNFVKNLSATKYQLTNLILKCLTEFRLSKSSELQLLEMIQHISTLLQRGLYVQADSLISKAQRIAEKHERFPLILELLAWKRRLVENSATRDIISVVFDIAEQEKKINRKIANHNEYVLLRARLTALRKKT